MFGWWKEGVLPQLLAVYCHVYSVYSVNYWLHVCVLCFVCWWPCYLSIVGILEQPNLKFSSTNQILLLDHDYGPGNCFHETENPHGLGRFAEARRDCVHLNTMHWKLQWLSSVLLLCWFFKIVYLKAVDRRQQRDCCSAQLLLPSSAREQISSIV